MPENSSRRKEELAQSSASVKLPAPRDEPPKPYEFLGFFAPVLCFVIIIISIIITLCSGYRYEPLPMLVQYPSASLVCRQLCSSVGLLPVLAERPVGAASYSSVSLQRVAAAPTQLRGPAEKSCFPNGWCHIASSYALLCSAPALSFSQGESGNSTTNSKAPAPGSGISQSKRRQSLAYSAPATASLSSSLASTFSDSPDSRRSTAKTSMSQSQQTLPLPARQRGSRAVYSPFFNTCHAGLLIRHLLVASTFAS
jgi:hypothetical protein